LEGNQLGSRAQRWENLIEIDVRRLACFIIPQFPNSLVWDSPDVNKKFLGPQYKIVFICDLVILKNNHK
jgi:hypothetical protein